MNYQQNNAELAQLVEQLIRPMINKEVGGKVYLPRVNANADAKNKLPN